MAKELTNGFDLKAKVSEGFLSDLFKLFTLDRRSKTVTWANQEHLLEVYFHLLLPVPPVLQTPAPDIVEAYPYPHLRLLPAEGNQSFVKLLFPFRAVIRTLGFEKIGRAHVVVPAKTTTSTDLLLGETTAVISVDLSQLSAGQIDFTTFDPGVITWADGDYLDDSASATTLLFTAYKFHFPADLFEQEVEPFVINALRTIEKIPITPKAKTPSLGYFTFRTYGGGSPFLGVFANTTTTSSSPSAPPTFSMPPLASNQPLGTNCHLLVPKEGLLPKLESAKAEAVKQAKEQHGVEIEDFALELKDGYILATGHAEDADFEAHLGLYVYNGILNAQELALSVDLPWWMDLLQVFPVGSIIILAIRQAVSEALHPGAVQDWSVGSFDDLLIFSEELGEIPSQFKLTLTVEMVNQGALTIRSNGVVIPGRASVTLVKGPDDIPERAFAHKRSKEFHRADCAQYHMELSKGNLLVFPNEKWAIRHCFNGCAYCYPDYNVNDLEYGYLKVRIQLSEPTGPDLEASLWLERVGQMTIHDVTVWPSLRLAAYKFIGMPLLANHVASIPLDVFAGKWKLWVARGSWSTHCEVTIPPRKVRKYVQAAFEVGSAGSEVNELAIPDDLPLAIGKLRI